MADSTMSDISKMKVVDLRKELKARGLSYAGDKAELVSRLQAAMAQDEHGDINLDSDEIDSDGVLEDEDDKSQNDILSDSAVDTLNEELALADHPPTKSNDTKPARTLKRKFTSETKNKEDDKDGEKEATSKKIVLNRSTSIMSVPAKNEDNKLETKSDEVNESRENNKTKITADIDVKTKLELRAKRFGLPVKMTEAERKEARKQRFGQSATSIVTTNSKPSLSENMEKLKKRAERFGQSVSKIMTDIENKERLEKRKAKFGTVS
ncbi:hypothetical protein K1T71_012219 [Dendrolimus kikuchii]|uniref:Uncharacterized protein n=1 Tax=Dendrolimus kikuchii TaxID=765133 RepID=A0ACC1CL03_9NEOP|nr:hypothetical protein K1T71_012219 [Dendrolimus kikuchii]